MIPPIFTDATALVPVIRCLDAELTRLRQEIRALKDTGSRERALFENDFLHVAVQSVSRLRNRDIQLSLILTNKTENSFLLSFVEGTPILHDEERGMSKDPEIEGLEVSEDASTNNGTEFGPRAVYRIALKFYGGRIRTNTISFNAILLKQADRYDETGEQFSIKLTGLSVAE